MPTLEPILGPRDVIYGFSLAQGWQPFFFFFPAKGQIANTVGLGVMIPVTTSCQLCYYSTEADTDNV